ETSLQIAIENGLTMEQLEQLNPGADLQMMLVGDILIVPDEGTTFAEYLDRIYSEKLRADYLHCETTADLNALCFFHLHNLSDLPLFDTELRAAVSAGNGSAGQAEAHIPLIQILPGESLPMSITVPGNFDTITNSTVSIIHMTWSDSLRSSFRIPEIAYTQTDRFLPDGISVTSAVDFMQEEISSWQDKKINILAAAYDEAGSLTGIRSLYSDFFPHLEITVYSNGRPISSVMLRLEAY
ncbi:MAG: LysM peptidoglycan-binding domain-containing protein, partial [Anaerolineaceae bacterium]|nr:LysM peptidoglycan-binding domain-containing protein [Anaerolineaceae bacterium]